MATTTRCSVWQRAAERAEELTASGKTYTLGKKTDARIVWAAGVGTPTHTKYAEPNAIAVVTVEWRRPEGISDDDLSTGGYILSPSGDNVRVAAHTNVFRAADGSLTHGPWIGEDGQPRKLGSLAQELVDSVMDW